MGKHAFSLDTILAGWQPDGETRVRHPQRTRLTGPGAVGRRQRAASRRLAGDGAGPRRRWCAGDAEARYSPPGSRLQAGARRLNRWRATHASGLITWADDLPTLHAWLLSTAQPRRADTRRGFRWADSDIRNPPLMGELVKFVHASSS
jgi:hypothetical protein